MCTYCNQGTCIENILAMMITYVSTKLVNMGIRIAVNATLNGSKMDYKDSWDMCTGYMYFVCNSTPVERTAENYT